MLFLDTSALLKRYVREAGTDEVLDLMGRDGPWVASAIARAEAEVTVCHLGLAPDVASGVFRRLKADWDRFVVVPVDAACLAEAAEIGCRQRVRTLDAIHLAAAHRLPGDPVFVSFDGRQIIAAEAMGLVVWNGG